MRWMNEARWERRLSYAVDAAETTGAVPYLVAARMVGALSLVERVALLSFVGSGRSFWELRREFPGVTVGALRGAVASLVRAGWLESWGAAEGCDGVRVCEAALLRLARELEGAAPGVVAASVWGLERLRLEVVALRDPLAWRVLGLAAQGVAGHAVWVAATGAPPGSVWGAVERLRAAALLCEAVVAGGPVHLLSVMATLVP